MSGALFETLNIVLDSVTDSGNFILLWRTILKDTLAAKTSGVCPK